MNNGKKNIVFLGTPAHSAKHSGCTDCSLKREQRIFAAGKLSRAN